MAKKKDKKFNPVMGPKPTKKLKGPVGAARLKPNKVNK